MPKLVCIRGANKGDQFTITEGSLIIGRNPNCGIILFDKKCSRNHCQIYKKGSYYAIEDLGSSNGTLLNGKHLTKKKSLKIGDKIRIGTTVLHFSNKGVGGLVEQTATDIAVELQGTSFGELMNTAANDVARNHKKQTDKKNTSFFAKVKSIFKK